MRHYRTLALLLVGSLHLLPAVGLLGAAQLSALYGIPEQDPAVTLLLRHRALLFALLGGFLVYASMKPRLQANALWLGAISIVGFLILAKTAPMLPMQLERVVHLDVVAGLLMLPALYADLRRRTSKPATADNNRADTL